MDPRRPLAYLGDRPEVRALVPASRVRVLDVGCSTGAMGRELTSAGHRVTGVESDAAAAALAERVLHRVVVDDIESLIESGERIDAPYDCVVLADVLEHLRDPWAATQWAASLLVPEGCLVVSVPNVGHAQTFWNLLVRRRWPYHDAGIFDRGHLRWFARNNLDELLGGTDLVVTELRRTHVWRPFVRSRVNAFAHRLGDLGTFQFVFRAERSPR